MNHEPDGRIVIPVANDPGGHHDARFAQEPRLQLRLLDLLVEMGMKMSAPHACHVVGHGRHGRHLNPKTLNPFYNLNYHILELYRTLDSKKPKQVMQT